MRSALSFGFRVSGCKFQVSGFEFQVSGFEFLLVRWFFWFLEFVACVTAVFQVNYQFANHTTYFF